MDLKKAFDTVNHYILLEKLKSYGLDTNAIAMMSNYLTNRLQQTFCNGVTSSLKAISCGVPQGSIMGPFLFILYVNDITKAIVSSSVILYADDTVIYTHAKTVDEAERVIQGDLTGLERWCTTNKLSM